jgi:hypothetical protein
MNGIIRGYDSKIIRHGDRIELHPATDLWMRGVRYGTVVGTSLTPDGRIHVELDLLRGTFAAHAGTLRSIEHEQAATETDND